MEGPCLATRLTLFAAILSLRILVANAQTPKGNELPSPPGDLIFPTTLVELGTTTIIRTRDELYVPDGFEVRHAIRVQVPVLSSLLGEVPVDRRLTIVVDPALLPKLQIVPPQPNVTAADDLLLDGNSRLLAAATEVRGGSGRDPILGAIGTSRLPSKRYTQRELERTWWALRNSWESSRERQLDFHRLQYDDPLPPAGSIELILRFEQYDEKRALLRAMSGRELSPAVIDLAEIALWDTSPEVQATAADLLLDYGRPVDPMPLVAALRNYFHNYNRFRVIGPLLNGWEYDDTGSGDSAVCRIVAAIHRRGAADRAVALDRLKSWNLKSRSPHIRWVFGDRPTNEELMTLQLEYYGRVLSLLEWDAKDYQDVLPALRADPGKHCTALSLLGEESAAEPIGQMMLQSVQNWPHGYSDFYRGQRAVERLQSARGVEPLYLAIEVNSSNQLEGLVVTVGRVEDPTRLDRLIRSMKRSTTGNPRIGNAAPYTALALWIALGRKP